MRTYSKVGIPFAIAHEVVVVTKILYSALLLCSKWTHFPPVIIFTTLVSNSTMSFIT